MSVSAPLYPPSQIFGAYGLRLRAEGIKGPASLPMELPAKNKTLMEAVSSPGNRMSTVTHESHGKTGAALGCLCAAAIGMTSLALVCSRSFSTTPGCIPIRMSVSAPLYLRSQISKAHGPCFSAEGIKGAVSVQTIPTAKNKNLVEAASSPAQAGREP